MEAPQKAAEANRDRQQQPTAQPEAKAPIGSQRRGMTLAAFGAHARALNFTEERGGQGTE